MRYVPRREQHKSLTPASAVFSVNHNVLAGLASRQRKELPLVRFGDDQWDFRSVPGLPQNAQKRAYRVDWTTITNSWWRLSAKEMAAAMLDPEHEAVEHVPGGRRDILSLRSVYPKMSFWRMWFEWLEHEEVSHLTQVTQDHCDRFLSVRRREVQPRFLGNVVRAVRDLAVYRPMMSESYAGDFEPWGRRGTSDITGYTHRRENKTPAIPEGVFDALLAAALFWVETASEEVFAGRDEARALKLQKGMVRASGMGTDAATRIIDERLEDLLQAHTRNEIPLPQNTAWAAARREDDLAEVNLSLLGKRIGADQRTMQSAHRRQMVRCALREVGVAPGGLHVPAATVLRADGTLGPWREPFSPADVRWALNRLVTACFVVIAGLSGMRPSEVFELRRGCSRRWELADGQSRWRIVSRMFKGRDHGGVPETWTVIEPVIDAVRVLERLAPADDDALLLTGATTELHPGGADGGSLQIDSHLRRFMTWIVEHGERAGLPKMPAVDGRLWKLTPSQFRRTLAVELGRRPHGTIASKVHLKHIRACVTEGYWGPAGESVSAFRDEVEQQARLARLEVMVRRVEQHRDGARFAGGGSSALLKDLVAVEHEMETFTGTVEQSERRLRNLLRTRAENLHIGLLNDCHFSDPRRARCLQKRGVTDAGAPFWPACEPGRCGQSVIAPEHDLLWDDALEQVEVQLGDPRLPKAARARLLLERERLTGLRRPGVNRRPDSHE